MWASPRQNREPGEGGQVSSQCTFFQPPLAPEHKRNVISSPLRYMIFLVCHIARMFQRELASGPPLSKSQKHLQAQDANLHPQVGTLSSIPIACLLCIFTCMSQKYLRTQPRHNWVAPQSNPTTPPGFPALVKTSPSREFPAGPEVRTPCVHCWGPRFNPRSGS